MAMSVTLGSMNPIALVETTTATRRAVRARDGPGPPNREEAPRAGFEPAAWSFRRDALYRRANHLPASKSLQIGSFSKGHEQSRRSTSYRLLFPLCSHLRGVRCDGSRVCSR